MIKTETVTIGNQSFIRTYSDTYHIRKVGTNETYTDAMEITAQQYEETDILLEVIEPTEMDMREALGILGVRL